MYNDVDCHYGKYLAMINSLKSSYGAVADGGNSATALKAKNENDNDNASGNGNGKAKVSINSTATLTEATRSRWNVSDLVFDAMHDLAMMAAYNKLLLPDSTFGFWGGFLSNAQEVSKNM
jgi:hypothetical protein